MIRNDDVGSVDDGFFMPDRVIVIVWAGITKLEELIELNIILF